MKFKRNTQTIVRLAGEKSRDARRRVIEAITKMEREDTAINFNTICSTARVSKTFLYAQKHADIGTDSLASTSQSEEVNERCNELNQK